MFFTEAFESETLKHKNRCFKHTHTHGGGVVNRKWNNKHVYQEENRKCAGSSCSWSMDSTDESVSFKVEAKVVSKICPLKRGFCFSRKDESKQKFKVEAKLGGCGANPQTRADRKSCFHGQIIQNKHFLFPPIPHNSSISHMTGTETSGI